VKSATAFAPDVAEAPYVDHSDGDREHDARQNTMRQILQRAGQKQKHDERYGGESELRDLAARARLARHSRLCRAAVNDKGTAQRRRGVGCRYSQNVRVLVDALLENSRINPRSRRALCDDHDETRSGDRKKIKGFTPSHVGPFE
jgi:hypothetical protein